MRKSLHVKSKRCTVKRAMAAHWPEIHFSFSPAAFLLVCPVLAGLKSMLAHLATLSEMWFVGREGFLCLGLNHGQCLDAGRE